jgi:hypothetical protein
MQIESLSGEDRQGLPLEPRLLASGSAALWLQFRMAGGWIIARRLHSKNLILEMRGENIR